MYRGFKQECPSGMVKEETFKIIYSQFFPRGADASQYAHFVFNTFDQDHTGAITFTDFVIGLSVLSRGSLQEKLRWTFNLYDINGDGYITKDELARIVKAVYDLMGKAVEPMVEENTTREHVERVFQKLDLNKDGVVTIDEFMDSCTKDENISKSMSVLDTILWCCKCVKIWAAEFFVQRRVKDAHESGRCRRSASTASALVALLIGAQSQASTPSWQQQHQWPATRTSLSAKLPLWVFAAGCCVPEDKLRLASTCCRTSEACGTVCANLSFNVARVLAPEFWNCE